MKRITSLALLFALLLLSTSAAAQEQTRLPESLSDIPFEKFVLDNGLTLIVHEDHKAPIVAINVWYHVGSKNEPDGRSGFAHLFEHLMFNGSENFNDDYFQTLERIGATDLNGTTNEDRTNYFQNVPRNAVDVALWMESDRMGHLLGAIDQGKLDEQRGVVQNEKRQGENQPYGQVWNHITDAVYPKGHPYDHTVIGSMDDLNAAELADVKEWFSTYYGPSNAVVAVAGDITAEEALAKVKAHFGDIAPGPPIAKYESWIAKRAGTQREIMQDRVPQSRIYKVWNVPGAFTTDAHHLDLATDVLTNGKTSRLYNRLVYKDQIATNVSAFLDEREIGSLFVVNATARPGVELSVVEAALDEELARLLADGPTEEELERAQTVTKAGFVRGIERIGGFGGKSDILARSEIYGGSPEKWKSRLDDILSASPSDVRETMREWLSDGVYILEVHPYPAFAAADAGVSRAALPEAGAAPEVAFPQLQRATLSNGLKIVLAERHAAPLVDLSLQIDAGFAADQGNTPGTANLAMSMLDEGTATRSALQISDALDMLGANLGSGSNLDMSVVSLSALKENLGPSLDLFADVVLNPAFPQNEIDRLKQEQVAAIQREKATPVQMALRVFPKLLYGSDHAYGLPLTGSGTEASVSGLTREDLVAFHRNWFKPNNATLVVVGDVTMGEIRPLLEARLGRWTHGEVPGKNIANTAHQKSSVYLLDRPGSQQSIIFAGHVAPPKNAPNDIAIETMNTVLGGAFISRVNMNLREDKGWAYGAFTLLFPARGQRPFIAYAPVQTDKTSESIAEIARELREIITTNPPTDAEVSWAKNNLTLSLTGQWETIAAVEASINNIVTYGLPDDYWDRYDEAVRGLTTTEVAAAARDVVRPDNVVWVIVGDLALIEGPIRALNLGEVHLMDADGNLLPAGSN